jgi:hypothetical protein
VLVARTHRLSLTIGRASYYSSIHAYIVRTTGTAADWFLTLTWSKGFNYLMAGLRLRAMPLDYANLRIETDLERAYDNPSELLISH